MTAADIVETTLTNWWCATCGMVTPGGRPDPYPCCTRPLVFRWRAVQRTPVEEPTPAEAAA